MDENSKVGGLIVMEQEFNDEVRVEMDLPRALRRELARCSLRQNTDLQSLIRHILEHECVRKEYDF